MKLQNLKIKNKFLSSKFEIRSDFIKLLFS